MFSVAVLIFYQGDRRMDPSVILRVVDLCHESFPHGVSLLLYMLEHGIRPFSMIAGDLTNTHISVPLICLTLIRSREKCVLRAAIEDMEHVFEEIGKAVRVAP